MSKPPHSPSHYSSDPEFRGAGWLCLLAMLNHVALTGGRITVSLTALQIGLSTFKIGTLVAVFAVLPMLFSVHVGHWVLSGTWDTHLFVVPIFGMAIGLSATTIGFILAAFAAVTFVIRLLLPFIQNRVRSWTLMCLAMVTAAIDFLIYPFFTKVNVLIVLSFILGLALGCCQPSMLSLLHHYSPHGRAAEAESAWP